MDDSIEKRQFPRFTLEFSLEVTAADRQGEEFRERAVLDNISGGGAKFLSRQPHRYFNGQKLEISIALPGSDTLGAQMRTTGRVVRIDPGPSPEDQCLTGIAVEFDTPLRFERLGMEGEQ